MLSFSRSLGAAQTGDIPGAQAEIAKRLDATQLQLKFPFDVDLDEPRQQSCASHLLERLAVARIRRVRQKDDAPEVQRRLLRPTQRVGYEIGVGRDSLQECCRFLQPSAAVPRNRWSAWHR